MRFPSEVKIRILSEDEFEKGKKWTYRWKRKTVEIAYRVLVDGACISDLAKEYNLDRMTISNHARAFLYRLDYGYMRPELTEGLEKLRQRKL